MLRDLKRMQFRDKKKDFDGKEDLFLTEVGGPRHTGGSDSAITEQQNYTLVATGP